MHGKGDSTDNVRQAPLAKAGAKARAVQFPRVSPKFPGILTHLAPLTTEEATIVRARQMEKAAEAGTDVDVVKPPRKVNHKGMPGLNPSTSQDHVVSDKYVQILFAEMAYQIREYQSSLNPDERALGADKKQGLEVFLSRIFAPHQPEDRKMAWGYLDNFLNTGNSESLKKASQLVAATGARNAVEGNASVNSGIGEAFDAPLNSQGRVTGPFARMRDDFLDLAKAAAKTVSGWDEDVFELGMNAVSPNLVGACVRASSHPYRERDFGSFESPGRLQGGGHFSRGTGTVDPLSLTDSQALQMGMGYLHTRAASADHLSCRPAKDEASVVPTASEMVGRIKNEGGVGGVDSQAKQVSGLQTKAIDLER